MCESLTARSVVTVRSLAVDCGLKQFVTSHHKTALDIPGAKNVTFFSKILNCKFLVLCFVLYGSRCVIVSCTRKGKCDGQLGPCHTYAFFRRYPFWSVGLDCVHIKTIKNGVYEFDHNQWCRGACTSPVINRICRSTCPKVISPELLSRTIAVQQHPSIHLPRLFLLIKD